MLRDFGGAEDVVLFDREDFVNDVQCSLKGRSDGFAPVEGGVSVQDLLQDFGVGYQALPVGNQPFDEQLSVRFVWVCRAHEIHRDVCVDEDHTS